MFRGHTRGNCADTVGTVVILSLCVLGANWSFLTRFPIFQPPVLHGFDFKKPCRHPVLCASSSSNVALRSIFKSFALILKPNLYVRIAGYFVFVLVSVNFSCTEDFDQTNTVSTIKLELCKILIIMTSKERLGKLLLWGICLYYNLYI